MLNNYSKTEVNTFYSKMSALRWKIHDESDEFNNGKQLMVDDILKDFEAERQRYLQSQVMLKKDRFSNRFTLDELISLI